MDISLYLGGLLVPFVLSLLALLAKVKGAAGYIVAGITSIAGLLGIYIFLGVGTDGSLTMYSNGTLEYLASATLNQFTWYFVTVLPLLFTLLAFMSALYRAIQK